MTSHNHFYRRRLRGRCVPLACALVLCLGASEAAAECGGASQQCVDSAKQVAQQCKANGDDNCQQALKQSLEQCKTELKNCHAELKAAVKACIQQNGGTP